MTFSAVNGATLHMHFHPGIPGKHGIVFANSLGTDFRIWDNVRAQLAPSIPTLTMDKRGHGLSDTTPANMETHIADLAALMDQVGMRDAIICGVSVGGMIAQGLATARPDLVAGLMLCNTAAKIGDADGWNTRISAVLGPGLPPIADAVLERWFSPGYRNDNPVALAGWGNMLTRTPADGYAATCAAIRDTDLTQSTATLRVPTVCVAGSDDLATPPALVETLCTLMPHAEYHCIDGVGHLPCIETPDRIASLLTKLYGQIS